MLPTYVLITPARNEARFIESTIQSVISQTVLPLKWVIVSDGSTDGTDEIVLKYAGQYQWITLHRMPERRERHFAGKVYAFNAGWQEVLDLPFQVVVSLDADITFDETYFEYLLGKLAADPSLGLVGTPFGDNTAAPAYDYRFVNIEHVSGACQVFRRECYEAIGGYVPVKGGAIDNIAVISARMKGWKTRTFTDKTCIHHREMGTAQTGVLRARFKFGCKDYAIGNHPMWELFRGTYQMGNRPYLIGGIATVAGYFWALLRRAERPVSRELIAFHRGEQMRRLKQIFVARTPLARFVRSGTV
ncbi:MAG TPA: glycosyltransferase family A protein [Terracidiphilus sp.]|nr:glycosyltransferase family A protein [Terracidiphilus sp.]